ncbi:MAG: hypothetical protein ABSA70_13590 [Terriglobia bacterium]
MPTVPLERDVVVMVNVAGLTVMVNCCCAESAGDPESVTCTVNVQLPVLVGVPEITPVDELSDNPGGSVPLMTLQVSVPAPPLACNVAL